jgi:radical SAM-linked protein
MTGYTARNRLRKPHKNGFYTVLFVVACFILDYSHFRDMNVGVNQDNQANQPLQRLRLIFSKEGPARFISHLDLARALERSLNRAQLPVAYTQGFNPRPRLSLAAALPLGYTSEAEVADVWLVESLDPADFHNRLAGKIAPGIKIHSVVEIPLQSPSLQQQVIEAVYVVEFLDPVDKASIQEKIAGILSATTFPWERKRRKSAQPQKIDLRPLILNIEGKEVDNGYGPLLLHLRLTPEQTGRPDDVLTALGIDPLDTHVHRRSIILAANN